MTKPHIKIAFKLLSLKNVVFKKFTNTHAGFKLTASIRHYNTDICNFAEWRLSYTESTSTAKMEELKSKHITEIYNNADSPLTFLFFFLNNRSAFPKVRIRFPPTRFSFSRSAKGCFQLLKEMRFH